MTDKTSISQPIASIDKHHLDQVGRAWSRMVDCITHDLKTPLVSLRMTGKHLEDMFGNLVKGYELAVENNLMEASISERHLTAAQEMLVPEIQSEVTEILDFINLLHPYNQQLFATSEATKQLNIQDCLENIVKNHFLTNEKERALLHIECSHNFKFQFAPIFIEFLFDNLIINALNFIEKEGKGEINIWTEEGDNYNLVHFQDTAHGLEETGLAEVFERFFSTQNDKIVPGLGFCRLALLQRGGNILCKAIKDESTDFIIKFPKI
ncbi:MAG TPA: HAMP domain-containing sensor histidine kinase [Gammaproteobacteria bacterium]|nr:HAMP domain-containing sensor histidine kinase [Gammaproteobacteria bacterium]